MYSPEGDLKPSYGGPDSTEIAVGSNRIAQVVRTGSPFFIGRNGSTEQAALRFWFTYRKIGGQPWPYELKQNLNVGAGVWPKTDESLDAWVKEYMETLGLLDGVAAGWYRPLADSESAILDFTAPNAFRTPLRSLEPYYAIPNHRWTRHLAGKRVAVVSSFYESVPSQVENSMAIWQGAKEPETILPPSTTWVPIRTFFTKEVSMGDQTEWPPEIHNWDQAADYIVKKVKASGASIALIGCGGLGMIIAGRLRKAGISAVVLGGSIQVLFGIKGRRWATHDVISKFWGPAWVWPTDAETPRGSYEIEGACYWKLGGSRPSTTPR